MTAPLLVIVPTRTRPHNVAELIASFEATRTVADLLVWVDDDPDPDAYDELVATRPEWCQIVRSSTRRRLCGTLNHIAPIYADGYGVLGFLGDDHRPRTPGWDVQVLAAMQSHGVVYGNDLIQGERIPTAVFMDAEIVRRTGRFVHPDVVHLYCDNAWRTLGEALGTLRYLPDVVIEHMHPVVGKAPADASYMESNAPERYSADEAAFRAWLAGGLARDVAMIRQEA